MCPSFTGKKGVKVRPFAVGTYILKLVRSQNFALND